MMQLSFIALHPEACLSNLSMPDLGDRVKCPNQHFFSHAQTQNNPNQLVTTTTKQKSLGLCCHTVMMIPKLYAGIPYVIRLTNQHSLSKL